MDDTQRQRAIHRAINGSLTFVYSRSQLCVERAASNDHREYWLIYGIISRSSTIACNLAASKYVVIKLAGGDRTKKELHLDRQHMPCLSSEMHIAMIDYTWSPIFGKLLYITPNAMVERFNRTLKSMLYKYAARFGKQWDRFLLGILYVFRNTPSLDSRPQWRERMTAWYTFSARMHQSPQEFWGSRYLSILAIP